MLMPTQAHARTIIEKLRSRNESVSVAESLTGGGLGLSLIHI
jgi:nicotinamide-nucleotide amidase